MPDVFDSRVETLKTNKAKFVKIIRRLTVRQHSQKSIFFWQTRMTLGFVARDAQLKTLVFDGSDGMAGAGGYIRIGEFAQECYVCFRPIFPKRILISQSKLVAA